MNLIRKGLLMVFLLLLGIWAWGQETLSPFDTLMARGGELIKGGDAEAAKDVFYAALELMPEDIEPNYFLGYCYTADCIHLGENCDLGISFMDKAIATDRDFQFPFYNRALCKFVLKDFSGALADINTQIEMTSYEPSFFLLRAEIYYSLDNKEGACNNFHWYRSTVDLLPEQDEVIMKLQEFCRE